MVMHGHRDHSNAKLYSSSNNIREPSNNNIHDDDEGGNESPSSFGFAEIARGGQAELLLAKTSLGSYFDERPTSEHSAEEIHKSNQLMVLAETCRHNYLSCGIAHIPNFVRPAVCQQMVQEATTLHLAGQCFYSTEDHTVYQEPHDASLADNHPRNALQRSSKWIMDYARVRSNTAAAASPSSSPLVTLYTSPHLKAFVSYVVRPQRQQRDTIRSGELFESGCNYNAAYYNIYNQGDGLGWHFDRSEFGVNLELLPAEEGGDFELCWNTRSTTITSRNIGIDRKDNNWAFDKVQQILNESSETACPSAQRIQDPSPVGPGSFVIFAGSSNLHRVTPITSKASRVNAIMTYETKPHQNPNAYSLRKFFGR